jgi:small ligand-binding sensory domain FIST
VLRAGVGVSTAADLGLAAVEAAEQALAGAGRCDAAILWTGPGEAARVPDLLARACEALGCEAVVGATAHGVIAREREHVAVPAVAIAALSGLEAEPFLIPDVAGAEPAAGEEIAARLGGEAQERDLVVLFPDPRALDPEALFAALGARLGAAQIVGAGAADPVSGAPLQWCGREVASGALAGVVLRGRAPARIGITQACRPATPLFTVTRCVGHWVQELDGRPALEVYREAARGPLAQDLRRAAAFVLVALPVDPRAEALAPGSYLVRHPIGFEEKRNAFAIPDAPRVGQRLALAQREPEAAREDLKAMLAGLASGGARPALGLYLDCCARALPFFGVPDLEAAYLARAFEGVPLAGMLGSCEIGPIGGVPRLLTYTGVLALLDA